jgi:hypothetical protein
MEKDKISNDENSNVRMDKNLIILEFMYHLNNVKLSIIKDSTYYSMDFSNLKEVTNYLFKLNTNWHIIIDANNNHYSQIMHYFKQFNLNFDISKPTSDQIRKIGINNLTLIGLYIYTRRLIKIR